MEIENKRKERREREIGTEEERKGWREKGERERE